MTSSEFEIDVTARGLEPLLACARSEAEELALVVSRIAIKFSVRDIVVSALSVEALASRSTCHRVSKSPSWSSPT